MLWNAHVNASIAFVFSSGGAIALQICFLVFLVFATFAIFFSPSPTAPAKATRYTPLRLIFVTAFVAILIYQMLWQIYGYTKPEFMKFLRRYNRRSNAADIQTQRGPIFDRNGLVLAAPVATDVWGRRYPFGASVVHPLGYFHSRYGITGVERIFDPRLSGYDMNFEKTSFQDWKEMLLTPQAKEGKPVRLTLDIRLQQRAYEVMGGRKGAVVVLVPSTGEILALVSSPGFDPFYPEVALRDEEAKPAFNRAAQGLYPPGSTFKLVVAALALDRGMEPKFNCPAGGYIAGPHTPAIRDSEYYAYKRAGAVWPGWGDMSMTDAVVHSSNVYFAQLGVKLGTEPFNELGIKTQIRKPLVYLQGESGALRTSAGNLPEVEYRRVLAQLCIGQGRLLVTPLHVACYTAALANQGLMMQPQLDADAPHEPMSRLCTVRSANRVKGFMAQVVTRGTGKTLGLPELEVCGKTGTAQVPRAPDHAWFTCFAPRTAPKVAVTVLVENGGFGAKSAMPVAREVLLECRKLGYL